MGNGVKPIAQTYFKVSNIKHRQVKTSLDYSRDVFTYLKNAYTANGMYSISVNDLGQLVNEYKNDAGGKVNDRCLLKGLYKDGYSGVNCIANVPYLFFDIDVKDGKENTHLLDVEANQIIFDELVKVSVLVWRSNSGNGIAGVLYVPQLANYLEGQKDEHLTVGKAITEYLSQYLKVKTGIDAVTFDQAQSKFRQVRFLAEQKQPRRLNLNPIEFTYTIDEIVKEYTSGVIAYKPQDHRTQYGTAESQYNFDTDILNLMLQYGFTEVSRNSNTVRVKHNLSDSSTTGEVNLLENVYFNYSETLGGKTSYTPARIAQRFQFNNNYNEFRRHLNGLGHKEKHKPKDEVKEASRALKSILEAKPDEVTASKAIYKYCFDLQTLSDTKKRQFINDTCTRSEWQKYFIEYLKLRDYTIRYDRRFTIENWVSESLHDVLNYVDEYSKIILRAETGLGKSTAFIRDFHTHRPNSKILILAPLTVIVDQNRHEYGKTGVFLDGTSPRYEFDEAKVNGLVFATYEQGIKLLATTDFDYIVIDEVHQLFTANSFKRKVIEELTGYLENNKVIGLTGTPNAIFKEIGYKVIDVDIKKPIKTNVEVRYSNTKPYNIALSHLRSVQGKTLLRLNDIKGLEALKIQLVNLKLYKSSEILILHSDKTIKTSSDFKRLAHERCFSDKIRLVLTTSLIDEGLSINQDGFTDVVFLEASYSPRPEAVKQFFARFRNTDHNRKNYLYLRKKNDQTQGRLNPVWLYNSTLQGLKQEADIIDGHEVESTHNAVFSNEFFYYNDGAVNPYFLGYSVTTSLFSNFNARQFLEYLAINYNLKISINKQYECEEIPNTLDTEYRKAIKERIAGTWINSKDEVYQTLALHTQSNAIRNEVTISQIVINPDTESFIINNIKGFEKLYNQHKKLIQLDVDKPDNYLIDFKKQTLISQHKYSKAIILLTLSKTINEPKNKADVIAGNKVKQFAEWCRDKESFTYNQMIRKLTELRIYKSRENVYSQDMLFTVLEWYGLDAKQNTKTKVINVSSK